MLEYRNGIQTVHRNSVAVDFRFFYLRLAAAALELLREAGSTVAGLP